MSKKKKILLVEDDETLSRSLSEMLQANDFEVFISRNGIEGLEFIKTNKPDLVLLDIVLPKMDGIELVKELQKLDEFKDMPVMMLTNNDDMASISATMEGGVNDYLVKHQWKLEDIVVRIKNRLGMQTDK